MDAELLRQYLEFYQDLGIKTLYRRDVGQALPPAHPPAVPIPIPMDLPPLAPTGDTLLKIVEDIGDCHRCRLSAARNKIVFGVGNPQSPLVFVDRKSTRLNSSHLGISYAVFCLKKKQ